MPAISTKSSRDLIQRIRARDFQTADEKRALYDALASSRESRVAEVLPFLLANDVQLRVAAGRYLAAHANSDTVRLFLGVMHGRPEAARRAALASLLTLPSCELVPRLEALYTDPDVTVAAADAIIDLPLTRVTMALVARVAESGDLEQRTRAAARFVTAPSEKYRSIYRKLILDPEPSVRHLGYKSLVQLADSDDLDLLLSRVGDEAEETQSILLEGVERHITHPDGAILERLIELLVSGSPLVRRAAVRMVLLAPDRRTMLRRFVVFARRLAGWTRERAVSSLAEVGLQLLDAALYLADDPDPSVRVTAFTLISGIEDRRVTRAASNLMAENDAWVAIAIAEHIGRHRLTFHAPALLEALERDDVRWAAVYALGRIEGDGCLQRLAELTQDPRPEIRVEAMTALANSHDPRAVPVLEQCCLSDTAKFVRARAVELYRGAARHAGVTPTPEALEGARLGRGFESTSRLHRLLGEARRRGASDLHVAVDRVPAVRVGGALVPLEEEALSAGRTDDLLTALLTNEQRARLATDRQIDACFFVPNDGRYRGSMFRDRKGLNAVFRVIPDTPPSLAELGAPEILAEQAQASRGLVLIAGAAGSGRTTTLAAVVNLINETRRCHVLTLEDPVEIVHRARGCLVNQRDLSRQGTSLTDAVRSALHQDVDVLVVGETRDATVWETLIGAAESGLLVLTTICARGAISAVEALTDSIPAARRGEVRRHLAAVLRLAVAQQLVPGVDGDRVASFEWLAVESDTTAWIRDGELDHELTSSHEFHGFDESLADLVRRGIISPEAAYRRARKRERFETEVSPKFREEVG